MQLFYAILVLTLASCAGTTQEKKTLAWEEWKGHSTEELKGHPYFKILPVKKLKHPEGVETWIFRDQTRFQTDAYCQSLGGCIGMPTYNCDNAFSVKNGKILGFEQNGSCPGLKTISPSQR